MIILAVQMGSRLQQRLRPGGQKAVAGVLCISLAGISLVWLTRWARSNRADGQDYASSAYINSAMLQTIRGLPKDARFYSNNPWPISIYAGRLSELIPNKINMTTLREDEGYRDQMEEFAETMHERDVYLAYFKKADDWFTFASLQDLQALVSLRVVVETADGTIYAAAGR
jgi:hypothetical protein